MYKKAHIVLCYSRLTLCPSTLNSLTHCFCSSIRGPADVKIENADSAVATVTGLEVGRYEFTLTVTDERMLQSTDTVTVIVREG